MRPTHSDLLLTTNLIEEMKSARRIYVHMFQRYQPHIEVSDLFPAGNTLSGLVKPEWTPGALIQHKDFLTLSTWEWDVYGEMCPTVSTIPFSDKAHAVDLASTL